MKKILVFACLVLLCGCQNNTNEVMNNVSEIKVTSTPVPTQALQETPTPMPTLTPTPTMAPQETLTPTPTPTQALQETLTSDTEPPVIEGLSDITIQVGENVSYKKGVVVSDNVDDSVELQIDISMVSLDTPGEYTVVYTATDAAGNTTSQAITIIVKAIDTREAEVKRLAAELVDELISEDMSKWDTCYTLWNWCRTKIKYAYSAGDRSSIYAGAYEGLHDRSGDCYAYYATFTILLELCDIETMEVRRVGGTSNHWWNLVNLGDGWYHCDSSPRNKNHKYKCFMQTDEQVQAYTEFYSSHPNYYTFDESLYPERETTIVFDGNITGVK